MAGHGPCAVSAGHFSEKKKKKKKDHTFRSKTSTSGPNTMHQKENTDNPLYTDTRYNDKIRYNDNLTVTKPSLKR